MLPAGRATCKLQWLADAQLSTHQPDWGWFFDRIRQALRPAYSSLRIFEVGVLTGGESKGGRTELLALNAKTGDVGIRRMSIPYSTRRWRQVEHHERASAGAVDHHRVEVSEVWPALRRTSTVIVDDVGRTPHPIRISDNART